MDAPIPRTTAEWLVQLREELAAVERALGADAMITYLRTAYPDVYQALKDDPRVRRFGLSTADGYLAGFEPDDHDAGRA